MDKLFYLITSTWNVFLISKLKVVLRKKNSETFFKNYAIMAFLSKKNFDIFFAKLFLIFKQKTIYIYMRVNKIVIMDVKLENEKSLEKIKRDRIIDAIKLWRSMPEDNKKEAKRAIIKSRMLLYAKENNVQQHLINRFEAFLNPVNKN